MPTVESGLVEMVREFLAAHRLLRRVSERYHAGRLSFDEVGELVGDDERSILFRLKERCHDLFRGERADDGIGPTALFDLAVGSLFHEAMKFRENFYQRSAYGPKVHALRKAAVRDESGLLNEFEKLIRGAGVRIDESLQELDTLLGQTTTQFRILLAAHTGEGPVARVVAARSRELAEMFGTSAEALLEDLYGSAAAAWSRAGHSFLASGFFSEAARALEQAAQLGPSVAEDARLRHYAGGMAAYLEGHYTQALSSLGEWLDAAPASLGESEALLARQAASALSRVGALAGAASAEASGAAQCLERLRALDRDAATASDPALPRRAAGGV
jgi:tetratricopeptide (TPR) repeat protein